MSDSRPSSWHPGNPFIILEDLKLSCAAVVSIYPDELRDITQTSCYFGMKTPAIILTDNM